MESGKSRRGERFIQRLVPSKGSLRSLQVLLLTILLGCGCFIQKSSHQRYTI